MGAAGFIIVGRAGYELYRGALRIEATGFVRAPVVLRSHVDRIKRALAQLDGLELRTRRSLHQIDESFRTLRRVARAVGFTWKAGSALFGALPGRGRSSGS